HRFHTTINGLSEDIGDLNERLITSNNDARYINSTLLYRRKFLKSGRSFSLDIKENYKEATGTGYLRSITQSDDTVSGPPILQQINQKKVNLSNSFMFSSKVIYTEPISKVTFLEFSYLLTTNHSIAKNTSYDSTGANLFDSINQTYTSNYVFRIINNRAGINFRFTDKKITFAIGSDISNANYQQDDYFRTNTLHRNYWNVFPAASFTYKFKKQTSLNLSYRGNTRQPTIDQVQTFQQNADPLNITVGNPRLKQEFTNRFYLRYNNYKVLTSQYTYVSLSWHNVADAISSNFTATPQGNKTQYINVDGNYGGDFYISRGQKLRKPEIYVGGHATGSLSHTLNFINDTANISNNNAYGFGPNFNYEKEDKFEINGSGEITFNENNSSISKFSGNYWILTSELSASVQLTKKIEIGSSIDYT
ncbi:MAG: hypothetical protein EBZ77_16385, partial [Chitinophagia bacterium]|nr:hypothetical protein [Chitinophagia bacterium]